MIISKFIFSLKTSLSDFIYTASDPPIFVFHC